jgi:hypothetical protein
MEGQGPLLPALAATCFIAGLHLSIPASKQKWVAIHCLVNAVLTGLTANDAWSHLVEPLNPHGTTGVFPLLLMFLLHVYHALCYPCGPLDYTHHLVMCSLLTVPIYTAQPDFIAYTNYVTFFICGLPGGIDYALMYLVYTDRLAAQTEKRINSWLNMYLRAPGILSAAFLAWIRWTAGDLSTAYALPTVVILGWNAQYFSRAVCISYGRHLDR